MGGVRGPRIPLDAVGESSRDRLIFNEGVELPSYIGLLFQLKKPLAHANSLLKRDSAFNFKKAILTGDLFPAGNCIFAY